MPGTTIPNVPPQFFDNNGDPAAGYQLFTYEAGTTTKLATYSDVDLSTPNANPIVLDSAGRATIFLSATSYKFVLADDTDTDPPTSPVWTRDNVSAIPSFNINLDVTGTAGEALSENDCVYLSDGSGSLTTGSWYKADADTTYSSVTARQIGFAVAAISSGSDGAIRIGGRVTGLSGLSSGSDYFVSSTAGGITSTRPGNARRVGTADSSTSLIIGETLRGTDQYEDSVYATVGNVGAGEDTLDSYNLGAGRVSVNGETVKAIYWGQYANNANTKTIKIHLDDTSTDTTILNATLTASEAGHWAIGFAAIRTGTATCRCVAQLIGGPTNAQTTKSVVNVTASFTCTWANAVEIRVTGEATTNDDITLEGGVVQVLTV